MSLDPRVTLCDVHARWQWRGLESRALWVAGTLDDASDLSDVLGLTGSGRLGEKFTGGYIEAGYGLIQGRDEQDGLLTHFLTAAYSRRYYNTLSNSTRLFANFGDDPDGESEGFAVISENSRIFWKVRAIPAFATSCTAVG